MTVVNNFPHNKNYRYSGIEENYAVNSLWIIKNIMHTTLSVVVSRDKNDKDVCYAQRKITNPIISNWYSRKYIFRTNGVNDRK